MYVADLTSASPVSSRFPSMSIINDGPVFLYHLLKGRPIHVQDDEVLTNLMKRTVRQVSRWRLYGGKALGKPSLIIDPH